MKMGGGGGELSFRFVVLLHHGLSCFTVMSEYSLDEPGFAPPVPPVPPSSSDSSVETPADGRRKCIACPRRMSKMSLTDIHYVLTVAVLIAMLIAVARSAWSGLRRRLLNMRSIASPLNLGNRLLDRRLLFLLLLRLPPDPLRNRLRHLLRNPLRAKISSTKWTRLI